MKQTNRKGTHLDSFYFPFFLHMQYLIKFPTLLFCPFIENCSYFRLLRRDPMGALGYTSLTPSKIKKAESIDGRPSEMSIVAALRSGEVLGSQTVLKSDHCPGCHNQSLPERVEGAPNFREVPGFPVYGVANPTIDGIHSVIQRIGSSKGGRPVFWHNMREEPVIYINGKPFVLREVERPYKNMLEYSVSSNFPHELCVYVDAVSRGE